jgi:hypothetical protein
MCAFFIPVSVPGLARYAVRPSPSLALGLRLLLLSKLKAPINHAGSTLLQVFFLKNLKPFGINTFEKMGEGWWLRLTKCYERVFSATAPSTRSNSLFPAVSAQPTDSSCYFPFSVFYFPFQPSILRTHFQVSYPASPLLATLTKTPGGMGVFFPFRNSFRAAWQRSRTHQSSHPYLVTSLLQLLFSGGAPLGVN